MRELPGWHVFAFQAFFFFFFFFTLIFLLNGHNDRIRHGDIVHVSNILIFPAATLFSLLFVTSAVPISSVQRIMGSKKATKCLILTVAQYVVRKQEIYS